jgi:hypothetical protein
VAQLIKTPGELKLHCSLIKTADTFSSSYSPDVDAAMRDFIVPILGQTLTNSLVAAYQASVAETSPTAMTSPLKDLLPKVQDVIAPLGYLNYLPKNLITSDDGGLTTAVDSETGRTGITLWQYKILAKQLWEDGQRATDALYLYLDTATAGTFPDWESSDGYTQFKDAFIQTTADFNKQYHINESRYTFVKMKAVMKDVEDLVIEDRISPELMVALKTKLKARTAFTTEEEKFVRFLKKGIAFLTIAMAAESLAMVFDNGLMAMPAIPNQEYGANVGIVALTGNELESRKKAAKQMGDVWVGKALNYLNTVASGTVMSSYFNSATYTANTDKEQFNQNKDGGNVFMML